MIKLTTFALFAVTVSTTACATDELAPEPTTDDVAVASTDEVGASNELTSFDEEHDIDQLGEKRCAEMIANSQMDFGAMAGNDLGPQTTAWSITSIYFHPNNGSHGGWIEAWRLCDRGARPGGGRYYQICTGGSAPVYFWNQPCWGSISSYYPQGWNGWGQSMGSCGSV